jgi:hypothetical protein
MICRKFHTSRLTAPPPGGRPTRASVGVGQRRARSFRLTDHGVEPVGQISGPEFKGVSGQTPVHRCLSGASCVWNHSGNALSCCSSNSTLAHTAATPSRRMRSAGSPTFSTTDLKRRELIWRRVNRGRDEGFIRCPDGSR